MMHSRKTPESLRGEKCFSCRATGSLRKAKLITEWEWAKNHVPSGAQDPRNEVVLCRLCESTYRAKLGQAAMTPDLLAVYSQRELEIGSLLKRRENLLQSLPKETLFGEAFGKVETKKSWKKALEKRNRW